MQINTPKNTKAGTAITQFLQFLHFALYISAVSATVIFKTRQFLLFF